MITYTHTQEITMTESKSGFEIRADLLSQAQGMLENNIFREETSIYSHNENHPSDKITVEAKQLKATDVITVAKELYEFVNQK